MKRKNVTKFATLGCLVLGSAGSQAQGLVNTQKISAALANELVGESVAQCAQKNYAVTAVVVDLDGVRQAVCAFDMPAEFVWVLFLPSFHPFFENLWAGLEQ
jgi:hypothetical protein